MGFTHIELLPIHEHPFYASWGYQPTGLYAPTARYGTPEAFRAFVQAVHDAGLQLILDWVPGHFPNDAHGLARFDGTALYEHADPREGFHRDWNTLIYNWGRNEVRNFLVGNALFWIERYGVDGLRVDAVASMLYRDYSRAAGEWIPNKHGGRENLEAIDFLRDMNKVVGEQAPGTVTMAEESTAFPGVTKPPWAHGLGFHYKWNMGWMNDTLDYFALDPVLPQAPPRPCELHDDVHVQRALRAAAVARRSGARQGLAVRPHARRRMAKARQPALAVRADVRATRPQVDVHGFGVRPAARMEPRRRTGLGAAAGRRARGRAAAGARPQSASTAAAGRCTPATTSLPAFRGPR